ncbi:MAG: damage-inducible protein DinB [Acidobacteria bacterium]|nr:MAG: damage-inducible protein DinB [Acidobacteriota bacterium]
MIRDMLLPEFDQEMANTRKILEMVPEGRFDYQPHPKSWTLSRLAGHVVDLPNWVVHTLRVEVLDLYPGQYVPFKPTSRSAMLDRFDEHVLEAHAAIAGATDEQLSKIWRLIWEGKTVVIMPRLNVLRSLVLNHLIHHRAQLGMYLRMLDVAVPGMYGPSADETPVKGEKAA